MNYYNADEGKMNREYFEQAVMCLLNQGTSYYVNTYDFNPLNDKTVEDLLAPDESAR